MCLLLKVFTLALIIPPLTCLVTCHKGHKWDFKGTHICDLCDDDTFMPEENHNKTECYPCTQVKDANTEVVKRECSREEDALIVCKVGFYRDGETCNKCTVCEAGHEIQPCGGHTDTICCPSDKFYVHVNTDGSTVCKVRTLPCRQGQFFVSGHNCTSCLPGTYMVDNHHNNNACNSCQQLPNNREFDDYIAKVCNITCNSSSGGSCRDGLTPDTGEDIHFVDQNKTGNVSDQMSTTPSVKNIEEAFHILRIVVYTVSLIVFLSGFVLLKCMNVRVEWIKLLKEYLADKGDVLATSMFSVMFVLVVSFLFISSIPTENSDFHILIHVVHFFAALCVCAMFVIAILCLLLIQHHSEKLSFVYDHNSELTSLQSANPQVLSQS